MEAIKKRFVRYENEEGPVSYTHLAVYKRQAYMIIRCTLELEIQILLEINTQSTQMLKNYGNSILIGKEKEFH